MSVFKHYLALTLRLSPENEYIVVKVAGDDVAGALKRIDALWSNLAPYVPIRRRFLDDVFEQAYQTFARINGVVTFPRARGFPDFHGRARRYGDARNVPPHARDRGAQGPRRADRSDGSPVVYELCEACGHREPARVAPRVGGRPRLSRHVRPFDSADAPSVSVLLGDHTLRSLA